MSDDLRDIQPDDLIAIPICNHSWGNTPHVGHEIFRVIKRTATQAQAVKVTSGGSVVRIRVADGKVLGSRIYSRAKRASPELVAEVEAQSDLRRRHFIACNKLHDLDSSSMRRLNTAQLEALADAWERVKAMTPEKAA